MNEANDNFDKLQKDEADLFFNNSEIELDASRFSNPVLQRLIEEVKSQKENNITAYNRLHNRHNRSR